MADFFKNVSKMQRLEQLAEGRSVVHRLHPTAKILATIVFIAAVISFGRYQISALVPFFFYPILMMSLSETPWRPVLYRLLPVLPFPLFGGLSNIVFDQEIAFTAASVAISYGMISCVSILLKTFLTVTAVLLLIATTPLTVIAAQLVRLKVPPIIVLQLIMTYRYIAVLTGEVSTMTTAYLIRSPRRKRIQMKDMGPFVGHLLLRSIDRAERIFSAMKCRGFQGVCRTAPIPKEKAADLAFLTSLFILVTVFRFINISVLVGGLLAGGF